jgi:hypothetical protein
VRTAVHGKTRRAARTKGQAAGYRQLALLSKNRPARFAQSRVIQSCSRRFNIGVMSKSVTALVGADDCPAPAALLALTVQL